MKSPEDMRIIQIDITNACIHKCSNCTRFCGHHKKPFYMDFETFKKAVLSFEGYNGTVGVMGGEPTLHPQFEQFLNYLNEHRYYPKTENLLTKPTNEFMKTIAKMEQRDTFINHEHGIERRCVQGYGLWSALSENYTKYYELIQDTFNFQAVNDHTNVMYHSPIMVRREDLKVSDDEWIAIRDNCWAQAEWSATITPKGAFFCEIAGALDMLFDGPGGWPIEPGWWKRKPEEFGEQLKWCELCGIAFSVFTRDANEEIDDMSQWYVEKLTELESPKVNQKQYNVLKINEDGTIADESKAGVRESREYKYTDSYFARFSDKNDWLNPSDVIGVALITDEDNVEKYINMLKVNRNSLSSVMVVVSSDEMGDLVRTQFGNDKMINVLVETKAIYGTMLNKVFRNLDGGKNPFIILLNSDTKLSESCKEKIKQYVFNPGSIMIEDKEGKDVQWIGEKIDAIFSPRAIALKKATAPIVARVKDLEEFVQLWDTEKIIALTEDNFVFEEYTIEKDVRYVLYGCGALAEELYQSFDKEQVIYVVDSDCNRWGCDFHGHTIINPDRLVELKDDYDKVYITSRYYFEIKDRLLQMGIPNDRIVSSINAM